MDRVKVLRIGIAPAGYVKRRMLEIAGGGKLLPGEPKVWLSSLDSLAKVLTESNMRLLQVIRDAEPQSLSALARQSGRSLSMPHAPHLGAAGDRRVYREGGRAEGADRSLHEIQLVVDFAEPRSEAA